MKLRDWMNKNSAVVTVAAVVVLILSLGYIILQARPGGSGIRVVDVYFYDLGSGETFVAKSDQYPPIQAPSGQMGVRAYVFSCGDCSNTENQFVGWLEMYTPEAKRALTNPAPASEEEEYYDIWEQGHLVSTPETQQWVLANSEAGFRIMEGADGRCGPNEAPQPCFPGR